MDEHRQILSAVEVDALIDDLQNGKSPKSMSAQPEVQAAVRLGALTSEDTIDTQFSLNLKQDIVQSLQSGSTEIVRKEKRRDIWKMLLLPIAPLGVTAAAIFVAVQLNQGEAPTEVAVIADEQPEQLLGAPVEDEAVERPEEGYTIDYVEFQRRLNERSTGDLVDLGVGNLPSRGPGVSTGAADEAPIEPEENDDGSLYTQLRADAYTAIATDIEIMELLRGGGFDVTRIEEFIADYKDTVASWPTDEDPFDGDAFSEAVDASVQHNRGWNRLMNEVTDELVRDYQDRHPTWQPGQPLSP